jgi:hypothetical protein
LIRPVFGRRSDDQAAAIFFIHRPVSVRFARMTSLSSSRIKHAAALESRPWRARAHVLSTSVVPASSGYVQASRDPPRQVGPRGN